jgi:hypothetical protein
MKKLISLPTWVLMRSMRPLLPKNHPFRKEKITLSDWRKNGTELLYAFDLVFWVIIISLTLFFTLIF